MTGKKWTFLLLSDPQDTPREFTLSRRAMRLALGGAGLLGLALLLVVGFMVSRSQDMMRAAQLQEENALLAAELEVIRSRVTGLQGVMTELVDRDAEVRVVAGLNPLDDDVLLAGIGGPGAPSLESHPLYEVQEELGESAFAATYDLYALERRARVLIESLDEAADSLSRQQDLLASTPSILPVDGRISSRFSNARFHPIHNRATPHEGIDVPAPPGTPIMASARGRVISAGRQSGYGLRVEIDHGNGITTLYAHASRVLVRPGQTVERGEVIAQVGSTGLTTSPHLHYEVRRNGRAVDPMDFILAGPGF